jgi:hypothetical protein
MPIDISAQGNHLSEEFCLLGYIPEDWTLLNHGCGNLKSLNHLPGRYLQDLSLGHTMKTNSRKDTWCHTFLFSEPSAIHFVLLNACIPTDDHSCKITFLIKIIANYQNGIKGFKYPICDVTACCKHVILSLVDFSMYVGLYGHHWHSLMKTAANIQVPCLHDFPRPSERLSDSQDGLRLMKLVNWLWDHSFINDCTALCWALASSSVS